MTANVSVVVAHRDNTLQIKNAALRYRPPEATPTESKAPGGAQPGAGRSGGPRGSAGRERRPERTVYVLRSGSTKPQAVQIKTGISDGIMTEVLEGLNEGDNVVIGTIGGSAAPSPASTNPFGPGPRRF
jgi:HlyD family secretion protein